MALSFPKSNSTVNQQKRGEIKTLKIFKLGQERASFKTHVRTTEPQGLIDFWRTSVYRLFTQCGRRGRNATALWPTPKQTLALPDPTRTASHWRTCLGRIKQPGLLCRKVSELSSAKNILFRLLQAGNESRVYVLIQVWRGPLCINQTAIWALNLQGFPERTYQSWRRSIITTSKTLHAILPCNIPKYIMSTISIHHIKKFGRSLWSAATSICICSL